MKPTFSKLTAILVFSTALSIANTALSEVLFDEDFDEQPDWTGATDPSPVHAIERHTSWGDLIPEGWDFARVLPVWAPSTGHFDRHESIEILASNSNKAFGGTGKSMVSWRDSQDNGDGYWNSEGLLLKRFEPQTEMYAEYKILFSPETYASYLNGRIGESKIFRMYAFTGDWAYPFRYFDGVSHPEIVWNLVGDERYGMRNKISLLGIGADVGAPDMPRKAAWGGGWSLSFKTDIQGRVSGVPEMIPDQNEMIPGQKQKNLEFIDPNGSGVVSMEQLFGPPGTWNKMAFYAKLNSAPGVHDGVFSQYLNGQRILHTEHVAWIPAGEKMRYWNVVGLGGNDYFNAYPNSERHEEWYAIDDLKVMNKIPDSLAGKLSDDVAPNPPGDIGVH